MTVSTITRRFTYAADGTNKDWPIEFEFLNGDNIAVIHIASDGTETIVTDKTVGVSTVTAPASGEAYPSGDSVRIERSMPYTQLDDYTTQGKFSPEDMERTADGLTMIAQQIRDVAGDTEAYVEENVGVISEWRDEAEQSAELADAAKIAAQTAQGFSETAKGLSEFAQGKSEEAQAASEFAQGGSEAARDKSEAARVASETARDRSEAARDRSEAAQVASEAARDIALGARDRAVTAEENAIFPARKGIYSSIATYNRGDIVTDSSSLVWLCVADETIDVEPATATTEWVPFTIVQYTVKEGEPV